MFSIYHYNLLHRNTFGVEAWADRFVEYANEEELVMFVKTECKGQPLLHIGCGSNLLFCSDVSGTVLHSGIRDIEQLPCDDAETVRLRVGGGVIWDELVSFCVKNGWYGLENLSLIPGEVGAAAVQNIGAYGSEVGDRIEQVGLINLQSGDSLTVPGDTCQYAYRYSRFKGEWRGQYGVTRVTLRLSRTFEPDLSYGALADALQQRGIGNPTAQQLRQIVIELRQSKLPAPEVLGNAGSFFMNPVISRETFEELQTRYPRMPHFSVPGGEKIPAAWLIEQAGWKGRTLKNAGVYDKQALVLVNRGGATGKDIVELSEAVRADVKRLFGIQIEPEVNFI